MDMNIDGPRRGSSSTHCIARDTETEAENYKFVTILDYIGRLYVKEERREGEGNKEAEEKEKREKS